MARGERLCCSPACEDEARLRAGKRRLKSLHVKTEAAAIAIVLAMIAIVVAIKWA
jgi:hypothetical protein